MPPIYLDNAATTRPAPEVVEAMLPFLRNHFANASSLHQAGQIARRGVEQARGQVAALINARSAEVIFTSGGTESIHLAILGMLETLGPETGFITTAVEHAATMAVATRLEKTGRRVERIGVDSDGRLCEDELEGALNRGQALVSIMFVNNETGAIFDVVRVAAKAREAGCLIHVDAVQAAGKLSLDVKTLGVDLLSLSAHKIHGPKGVGALWIRPGLKIAPTFSGGHQERDLRAGTENVAGIVGCGVAASLATERVHNAEKIAQKRDRFERAIVTQHPNAVVAASNAPRVCNITTICFPNLPAESMLIALSERGIYASSGAACSSGSIEPSHVLTAMRLEKELVGGAIRFSLSHEIGEEEIDKAVAIVLEVAGRLSEMLA